ncbi:MAG: hypothetical protein GY853_14955 [PVC group bacterium]|nr:hypothetical protein [PVC group bacterium]
MKVCVLNAKEVIYEGAAREVVLPADDGEMCVLDFHESFLYCLKQGMIRIDNQIIPVKSGVARMKSNELIIMVEKIRRRKSK